MSDLLLELGSHPTARKMAASLGLPIPMPQPLRRARGPWEERPLHDQDVVVGGGGELSHVVAQTLAPAGANPLIAGGHTLAEPFGEPGEAYGRRPRVLTHGDADSVERVDALVFDGSSLESAVDLAGVYDFFHDWIGKLARCGRAIVLGRPHRQLPPERAAAQRALEGFVRSLAKEIGKKGSTALLLRVAPGAEGRAEPVLRWLSSARSAFVSGQPIDVDTTASPPPHVARVRPLEHETVLLTGAARGIGKATAKLLSAEGAHVVCLDRPDDAGPVSQVARDVGGEPFLCDVSDAGAPKRVADHFRERGVDVVVHNAGVTRDKTIGRMKPEQWRQAMDINLRAVVDVTGALVDGPLRDHGRIVCLSSVAGIAGNVGQTNYAASKAGIIGFVEALAPELADRGICVNAVAPGFIETRLTRAIPTMIREVGRRLSSLGQGGLPEDVGQAITFLASRGASGITGRTLRVCGGAFIGA